MTAAWARRTAGVLLAWAAVAFAQVGIPPATAHVIDQTGSLDVARAAALETRLADFERASGSQVVVLIVPTTAPETIDQYGIRVAEQWRPGRKGVDDGVIVLVALRDRAARIEVGYGLEGVLTDAESHRILAGSMLPRLRAGDVAGGVEAGVDRILATIQGAAPP
ncbi:MAG TPA: TPM domain-containing protein, partial [Burkholderiaceae bacterium]